MKMDFKKKIKNVKEMAEVSTAFPHPSPVLASELRQSGLKLPAETVMTQQAGDNFGQNRKQQHRSCGSLPCHQSLFLSEKNISRMSAQIQLLQPQFRSALTLARVAVLKTL